MSKKSLEVGDRIIVMGRPEVAKVSEIKWSKKDFRYEIIVDWGAFGKSRVWDTDEGKVWRKYTESN
jgi:hypothetical protein